MSATAVLNKSGLLAIATEDTPGDEQTLAVGDVDIPVANLEWGFDVETHENELQYAQFGTEADFVGISAGEIKFMHYLRAGGSAGVAPAMGSLLTMSNMSETIVATTSTTYKPITPGTTSVTAGVWRRLSGSTTTGNLWRIKGAVCTQTRIKAEVGKPFMVEHTFRGAFEDVTDATYVTPTFSETGNYFQALATSMTIGSWTPLWSEMEIVIDYDVQRVDDPGGSHASGIACFEVTGRKVSGSITCAHQSKATKDFMSDIQAGTEAALSLANGGSAGSIITITAPKLQFLSPSTSDNNGLDYVTLPFVLNRNSGDDELVITLT